MILRELLGSVLAVVYPTDCPLCGQELTQVGGLSICRTCWDSLEAWAGPVCARCGSPFASVLTLDSIPLLCSECRLEEQAFDLARSYGLYDGNLRQAILLLKFGRRERLGKRLGELLASAWQSMEAQNAPVDPILVPVPLHRSRQRERGFNQAELLARGLTRQAARAGGKPRLQVETRCLYSTRATAPQTGLSRTARRENVRGVFAVGRPAKVRDRAVLLIDDVMTTGATLAACATALKDAGASRVLALTLAHATPQFPIVQPAAIHIPVDEAGRDCT